MKFTENDDKNVKFTEYDDENTVQKGGIFLIQKNDTN